MTWQPWFCQQHPSSLPGSLGGEAQRVQEGLGWPALLTHCGSSGQISCSQERRTALREARGAGVRGRAWCRAPLPRQVSGHTPGKPLGCSHGRGGRLPQPAASGSDRRLPAHLRAGGSWAPRRPGLLQPDAAQKGDQAARSTGFQERAPPLPLGLRAAQWWASPCDCSSVRPATASDRGESCPETPGLSWLLSAPGAAFPLP